MKAQKSGIHSRSAPQQPPQTSSQSKTTSQAANVQPRATSASSAQASILASRNVQSTSMARAAVRANTDTAQALQLITQLLQRPARAPICHFCQLRHDSQLFAHSTQECRQYAVDDNGQAKLAVTLWRMNTVKPPAGKGVCYACWLPDLDDTFHTSNPDTSQKGHLYRDVISSFAHEVYYHQKFRNDLAGYLNDRQVLTQKGFHEWLFKKYGDTRGMTNAVRLLHWVTSKDA